MNSVDEDARLRALLDRLHALSLGQEDAMRAYLAGAGARSTVGTIVVTDNTTARRREYAELFDYLRDPAHGFSTMTLPFDGGLEMSIRVS